MRGKTIMGMRPGWTMMAAGARRSSTVKAPPTGGDPRGPEPWRKGNGPQRTVEVVTPVAPMSLQRTDGVKVVGRRAVRAHRRHLVAETRRARRTLAREVGE